MSLLRAIRVQIGLSVTPDNNFTFDPSADNGTLRLYRGNSGVPIADIFTVAANGNIGFGVNPSGPQYLFGKDQNASTLLSVQNTTAGTAASAGLRASSNSVNGYFLVNSSATTGGVVTGGGSALIIGCSESVPVVFFNNNFERMRINTGGELFIGTTTSINVGSDAKTGVVLGAGGSVFSCSALSASLFVKNPSGAAVAVWFWNGTNGVGQITTSTTNTAYGTASDHRLKNITGPLVNSGLIIDALNPVVGTWVVDGSPFAGFLAHEFQSQFPDSVTGVLDEVDVDLNPVYQVMDASTPAVIAVLVAELQSLRARVTALGG